MRVIHHPEKTIANKVGSGEIEARFSTNRRSSRVVIDTPVTVAGQNMNRRMFVEHAKTVSVSAHGALIHMKSDVDSNRPVLLSNPRTGMEVQCRVANRKDLSAGGAEIGLEFDDALPKFWGIHFPPEDWNPAERKKPDLPQRRVSVSVSGSKR